MARAFGNLCRELFGSHLFIKDKLIIDKNCNFQNINTATAANICVNNNLIVKGNASINNLLVPDIIGNLNGEKVFTGILCERQVDQGISVVGNMSLQDSLSVCGELAVDLIVEKTPGNGVCIGKELGEQIIFTTVVVTEGIESASVTGDAVWQSFEIKNTIILSKINVEMTRTVGFINAAMEARIFKGISTNMSNLVATIQVGAYSGGDIDFSSLNLVLEPGIYTLQMDYPFSPPVNPTNYIWTGHKKINGEYTSSLSNTTLHMTIFTFSNGGIKVGPFQTCVKNILKLEFPQSNCTMQFVGLNPNDGLFSNGFMQIVLTCDGIAQDRTLSFDGEIDFGDLGLGIFDNVCANIVFTNEIESKIPGQDIVINSNIIVDGNISTNLLCSNVVQTETITNKNGNTLVINSDITTINGNIINMNVDNVNISGNTTINGNTTIENDLCVLGTISTSFIIEKEDDQGIDICGNVRIKDALDPLCVINQNSTKVRVGNNVQVITDTFSEILWSDIIYGYQSGFPPLQNQPSSTIIYTDKPGVYEIKTMVQWLADTIQIPASQSIPLLYFIISVQISLDSGTTWIECGRDLKCTTPPINSADVQQSDVEFTFDPITYDLPPPFNATIPQSLCCECPIPVQNGQIRVMVYHNVPPNTSNPNPPEIGSPSPNAPEQTVTSVQYLHEIPIAP